MAEPVAPEAPDGMLHRLRVVAGAGTAVQRAEWRHRVGALSPAELARLDRLARPGWGAPGPLGPATDWAVLRLDGPDPLVAAVASLHPDGRLRERAVWALGTAPRNPVSTAFLALRCVDPVPQVRDRARALVLDPPDVAEAALLLDVLTSTASRLHGPSALDTLRDAVRARLGDGALVLLSGQGSRVARRTAARWALDAAVLGPDALARRAVDEPDQVVRGWCVEALLDADPGAARSLLRGPSAAGRARAVRRGTDLGRADVEPLLLARAARVRRAAQWWVTRDGGDAGAAYREAPGTTPAPDLLLLQGRRETGDRLRPEEVDGLLAHPDARVRLTALRMLDDDAAPAPALAALQDPSPRVVRAAATALRRTPGRLTYADLAEAASSDRPWVRTAAWRVRGGLGAWGRLRADLESLHDPDERPAALAAADLRAWTARHAAEAGPPPPDAPLLLDLVRASGLDEFTQRLLAFQLGERR